MKIVMMVGMSPAEQKVFTVGGKAKSKIKAKKKSAYVVIVNMLWSAGIRKDEWNETMFSSIVK